MFKKFNGLDKINIWNIISELNHVFSIFSEIMFMVEIKQVGLGGRKKELY